MAAGARFPVRAVAAALLLAGCGGEPVSPRVLPPPPTPTATLAAAGTAMAAESENPTIEVMVELDLPARNALSVPLEFGGTATLNSDYAVSAESVQLAEGARSGSVEIDIYRDFIEEGDETITVSLGSLAGSVRGGEPSSVELTIEDGEAAEIGKDPANGEQENELVLLPIAFAVTDDPEDAVVFVVAASLPEGLSENVPLVGQWSPDSGFGSGVRTIATYELEASDDPFLQIFGNVREFRLPLEDLPAGGQYFVRAYLGAEPPAAGPGIESARQFYESFAINAEGRVVVRCETPMRRPAGGGDPLFHQQWHLENTGQTAFSDRGGTAGADLRMAGAIADGRNGAGIKLAVVDTGLELCHPDLAASTARGESFNFAYAHTPGASRTDPFNFSLVGDHGTSVAGVAAAAAGNGHGGRGVAPDVALVGFNPASGGIGEDSEDPDAAFQTFFLQALGAGEGGEGEPDSASVDIFNMSFGTEAPGENSTEEAARLFRMGVTDLRGGRGALYVRAAGNLFDACGQAHPFHRELGCVNSNSDPDHNLPWLINVGGFNADNVKSSYSSVGSNLWVVGPSGEDGEESPAMITTDQAGAEAGYSAYPRNRLTAANPLNRDGDYVSAFGGTSSAAPAVAGAIAVLLGAHPDLTWRDVKHILAATARRIDPGIAEVRAAFGGRPYVAQHPWRSNAAGYYFHNWYGFGAVDLDAALSMAQSHTPDSLGGFAESQWFEAGMSAELPDADGAGASAVIEVAELPDDANIEAVVLEITAEHRSAYDLGVSLRSPGGMENVLNPPLNKALEGIPGLRNWRLLSNAFYGENPNGGWTVQVTDIAPGDTGSVTELRLKVYYGRHPAN